MRIVTTLSERRISRLTTMTSKVMKSSSWLTLRSERWLLGGGVYDQH